MAEVSNRLYEQARDRKKKKEELAIEGEQRQLKDCTFVPKVRKTKYLKKARISRFGEDTAYASIVLQNAQSRVLQDKVKKVAEAGGKKEAIPTERKVLRGGGAKVAEDQPKQDTENQQKTEQEG